ncbi:hypothetical protein N5923_17640 [Erwiniaceae bacterium BAC15a-03b]|uniref:Phage membrane protein n=1 Tax=Winslowiella arboricola TaxID=2978220 RepID=A0A9J6PRG1_9GAMM|nr:hypothetical protein [Winslowiella arboricola]MCU5775840.1 hypothetical protein [Winslowiella arboricola]MCU5779310.1 hypothetical protein [Winslowiella arboricola]
MDTIEQLDGTYFYGGLTNLSAGELFFWIMIDVTAEHFTGVKEAGRDIMAAAAVYSGQNNIAVSGKLANATPGTSRASVFARKHLQKYRLPFPLPTFINTKKPPYIKTIMTHKLGTFVGRTIPVIGWAVLAADVSIIAWKAVNRYNTIASEDDRL